MSEKKQGRTKARSGARAYNNYITEYIAGTAIYSDWSILTVLSNTTGVASYLVNQKDGVHGLHKQF